MAKNFIQPGDVLTTTSGGAVASGAPVVVGELVGVALGAAAGSGEAIDLALKGVFRVTKLSTDTPAQGAILYWDAANARATTTASTHKRIGHAWKAAGNGVTTVEVRLG